MNWGSVIFWSRIARNYLFLESLKKVYLENYLAEGLLNYFDFFPRLLVYLLLCQFWPLLLSLNNISFHLTSKNFPQNSHNFMISSVSAGTYFFLILMPFLWLNQLVRFFCLFFLVLFSSQHLLHLSYEVFKICF